MQENQELKKTPSIRDIANDTFYPEVEGLIERNYTGICNVGGQRYTAEEVLQERDRRYLESKKTDAEVAAVQDPVVIPISSRKRIHHPIDGSWFMKEQNRRGKIAQSR